MLPFLCSGLGASENSVVDVADTQMGWQGAIRGFRGRSDQSSRRNESSQFVSVGSEKPGRGLSSSWSETLSVSVDPSDLILSEPDFSQM